ncbi:DUF2487 family protein [Halobacillus rhizosphaerae]|uniref:DUF2487 family protein n=1 Tax=Halobacillus rhizosphaerae TaxID=3064889 RepID=UPI00398AD8FD
MQWTKSDVIQYLPEKSYVDTLLIPLIPFNPAAEEQMVHQAFQRELNQIFMNVIEKEFRGRIFLSPDYYYLHGGIEEELERVNEWVDRFSEQPYQYIFLFTFDPKWKKIERELNGNLIWIPGMKDGNIQSTEIQSFVKEQADQITELIQGYW